MEPKKNKMHYNKGVPDFILMEPKGGSGPYIEPIIEDELFPGEGFISRISRTKQMKKKSKKKVIEENKKIKDLKFECKLYNPTEIHKQIKDYMLNEFEPSNIKKHSTPWIDKKTKEILEKYMECETEACELYGDIYKE